MLTDLLRLFFPLYCPCCKEALFKEESHICTGCLLSLPRTRFHEDPENKVEKLFWGRTDVTSATALYHFFKGGKVQQLLHELKYNGNRELGVFLGRRLGEELSKSERFASVDGILNIPLHPKKKKTRGFDQCEAIVEGIVSKMDGQDLCGTVRRRIHSSTQTNRSRLDRWRNVEGIFKVKDPEPLKGKHLLLVDDVITTGSTLEACIQEIRTIENTSVSVACLACP